MTAAGRRVLARRPARAHQEAVRCGPAEAAVLPSVPAASDAPKPRAACAQVVRPSAEQSASMSSAGYAAASDAPVPRQAAVSVRREAAPWAQQEAAVLSASAEVRQPGAALWALAAERHRGVGPDAVRLRAARPLVEPWARPLVEPWAFRRGRLRLVPVQRRLTRVAPATARSRIASPSGRSWQAA